MSFSNKPFFFFAGEPSGDLHGFHLIRALRTIIPELKIMGVGGPRMRSEGMTSVMPMENFSVMGFTDVFLSLPKLYRQYQQICQVILETNPPAIILIDYPGFNLRLARSLRKKGFKNKIIHYISPSVWAWGKKRIEQMTNSLDLLLTIFPFEKAFFARTSLKVEYVGNPLKEYISKYCYQDDWYRELGHVSAPTLAIFPGSRSKELHRNLPKIFDAVSLWLQSTPDLTFGISCADDAASLAIEQIVKEYPSISPQNLVLVPKKYSYELMRDSRTAIAKSGTVCLELALHERPTVAVYQLSPFNYIIAKYLVGLNLPHYCIVNILRKKETFPELIERGFSAKNLHRLASALNSAGLLRENCLNECRQLKNELEEDNASQKAANVILELFA